MATLNLRNPNGYDGSPGTQYKQGIVRFATDAEVSTGTATNVAVTVAQLNSVSTGANFASPPVLGFGSTTPRPVHATTLSASGLASLAAALTVGTTLDVTGLSTLAALTVVGTTSINASGSGVTTIGTGGTGATNIGNATGNTIITGSLTTTTTLTATLGNITATNGNIVRGTAGNKDVYSSVASTTTAGANSAGKVTLVGGTATISTTAVTASSQIRLYRQSIGSTGAAALGILTLGTISAGTSFVINAVQAADATALQASDVSSIGWEIVN